MCSAPAVSDRGRFVVLDGVDGCGKSTQAKRLVERLQSMGRDVLHTREPGGTRVGERVRNMLLDPAMGEIEPMAELFLYQAARAQLATSVIEPALEAGRDVVCERWHYATRAYQGAGSGLPLPVVDATSRMATSGIEPDRAVLLDVPDAEIEARLNGPLDRMEAKGASFRRKVAAQFREHFREEAPRCCTVDGSGTPDDVHAAVWTEVASLFGKAP